MQSPSSMCRIPSNGSDPVREEALHFDQDKILYCYCFVSEHSMNVDDAVGWRELPSDLLAIVSRLIGSRRSFQMLFCVCKSWNMALKEHLVLLQPAFPGPTESFSAVVELRLPLKRWKFEGALVAHMPSSAMRRPADISHNGLHSLDISGQDVRQGVFSRMIEDSSSTLESLDLSFCSANLEDISRLFEGLSNLERLSLSGEPLGPFTSGAAKTRSGEQRANAFPSAIQG